MGVLTHTEKSYIGAMSDANGPHIPLNSDLGIHIAKASHAGHLFAESKTITFVGCISEKDAASNEGAEP